MPFIFQILAYTERIAEKVRIWNPNGIFNTKSRHISWFTDSLPITLGKLFAQGRKQYVDKGSCKNKEVDNLPVNNFQ